MYELFTQISAWLSQPFARIAYSTNVAIIAALFLGVVGSLAPCQISANIAAITYFGNRMAQQKISWLDLFLYVLGKILVFSLIGLAFWAFGRSFSTQSLPVLAYVRKILGPLLVLMGLFLLGWIKLPVNVGFRLSGSLTWFSEKIGGRSGAFLMGSAFSLGFCPTMFWLFFGLLMPMVVTNSAGILLPPVFAVGTAMPLLVFAGLFAGLGLDQLSVKKAKNWGSILQKITGIILLLLGISDTLTYWTL